MELETIKINPDTTVEIKENQITINRTFLLRGPGGYEEGKISSTFPKLIRRSILMVRNEIGEDAFRDFMAVLGQMISDSAGLVTAVSTTFLCGKGKEATDIFNQNRKNCSDALIELLKDSMSN